MRPSDLHVIAVFNNNRRWHNRERLLKRFIPHMLDSGVTLTLVEHVMGEREFLFSPEEMEARHVRYFQIRGDATHETWLKEGLIRYGVSRLPQDAKYIATIDADIFFQRSDWARETLDMLQVHPVGQPWSHSIDLGPDEMPIEDEGGRILNRSFAAAWAAGDVTVTDEDYGLGQPTPRWLLGKKEKDQRNHFGYAWAFRLDAWSGFGGFPDWVPTGAADYFSALAFAGLLDVRPEKYKSEAYARRLHQFALLCDRFVRQDIGVVPGLIAHGWHGGKKQRFYMDRGDLLVEAQFNPDTDIGYDRHGLPFLCSDNRILLNGLRRLSVIRNEDATP